MGERAPQDYEQLAWEFESLTRDGRVAERGHNIFRALGHYMTSQTARSKEPIRTAAGLEVAFAHTLNDFRKRLTQFAQGHLLEFLIDQMPAQAADYRQDDPYFKATLNSFGTKAVFNHVIRPIADLNDVYKRIISEDQNPQLTLDAGEGDESAGNP